MPRLSTALAGALPDSRRVWKDKGMAVLDWHEERGAIETLYTSRGRRGRGAGNKVQAQARVGGRMESRSRHTGICLSPQADWVRKCCAAQPQVSSKQTSPLRRGKHLGGRVPQT